MTKDLFVKHVLLKADNFIGTVIRMLRALYLTQRYSLIRRDFS